MEQTIDLHADGSGTQDVRLVLGEKVIAEVRRASVVTMPAGGDPLAVFDRKVLETELQTAGLSLTAWAAGEDGGRRRVTLTAGFADFAGLKKSPLCGSAAEWELGKGEKAGTVRLSFYPQGKAAWTEARARAEAMQKEVDPTVADWFRRRQEQLAGLDVTFRFRLPGKVVLWTRNMEKTGEQEVTAHVTAAQIQTPVDLVRRLAPRFEVVFDGTGCKLPVAD